MYIEDIDTPEFSFLNKQTITKHFVLEPLENRHFLDLLEFRMQNQPIEIDPFDNLEERLHDMYSDFFTYVGNSDKLAWVLLDRVFVVGFFLLEIDVDYNDYLNRSAHLYYEMSGHLKGPEVHEECIKGMIDVLFGNSDIPRIELHLEEAEDDIDSMAALTSLGFIRKETKTDNMGYCYFLLNTDPEVNEPPRHMPYILKSYRDHYLKKNLVPGYN
ncbi:MAG: hypothetical protein JXB33_01025 [Clostridia bacterium]|nr:hypothetical protein [Clostridia bacterium]